MFRFGRKKSQEPQDSYTNPPDENKRGNGLGFLVGRATTNAKGNTPAEIEPDSGDEKFTSQSSKGQSNRNMDSKVDDASYASSLTSHSRTRPHDSYQTSSQRIVEEEDSGAGLSAEEKFMTYFQQKRASESMNQSKTQPKIETAALSTHVDVSDDEDVYNSGDHLAMMAAAARKDEGQQRKQKEAEEARKLQQRQQLQQEENARLQQTAEEERRLQNEQTATETGGQLTEEQRRAKARQAVEDRKRKAREAVEARKAKARQATAQNTPGDGETQEAPDAGDGRMLIDTAKQSDEALREKQRLLEEADAARKAQQEKERIERELAEKALQEKLRQEEEDLRRQQEELRQEELRLEEEMREAQEKARVEEEFRKLEEEERKLNEEMARLEEEANRVHDQTRAIQDEEYDMDEEEATPAVAEDDEQETFDEVQRQAEEWIAEEAQKLVENAKLAEEAQRAAEEKEKKEKLALEKAAEEARLEEERRDAETRQAVEARLVEERRQAEARIAEEARFEEERRQAEEARIAEEARFEEERRQAEEARIVEEAKLEEERRLVEEARVAAEQLALEQATQVEEARRALERFTDEQNTSQTFQEGDAIDENYDDMDNGEMVVEDEEYDMAPDIEPSETDLSALLGGDDDALFDSALDGPPEPASPVKNKSIIRNSFTKLLTGGKNKVTEKKKKENMGLRFYKPKSVSKDISTQKTAPASTKVVETTKVRITPPKPQPAPPTKRIPVPQQSLPPPTRYEPEPPKQEDKTPDRTTDTEETAAETIESVVSHVPESNHRATTLAARGFPMRRGKKALTKSPRGVPQSPARSVDSTGSVASIDRIPRSPYMKLGEDEDPGPSCSNPYHPTLHGIKGACQICVFRLSEIDRERFEKNGRSLLVNTTAGGCIDCNVFPSHEGEEPVRICRQCFFNTHLQCKREEEAFAGLGALAGAMHRPLHVNGRPSL